jgi:2-dehydropantoate 2-reductase
MRVAIVGPGAMGNLFAYLLARNASAEVRLLDNSSERARKISTEGLFVEGVSGEHLVRPKIDLDAARVGPVDLVILCVKGPDTYAACRSAEPLFRQDTPLLTLQNGMGNIEEIERALGPGRALGGTTSMGATVLDLNRIRHAGWGETIIGEPGGSRSGRAERILDLFQGAGLAVSFTDNLPGLLWSKLVINVGINALTALTRLHNGELVRHEGARQVMKQAVEEAVRVAEKMGIRLLYDHPVDKVASVCEATAGNVASMLQDVLKEKRTEIRQINGVVVRHGVELGIPTPANEVLLSLVNTLEESYEKRIR